MDQVEFTTAPYTYGMAGFISKLRFGDIPDEVIERLKLLILDSLGCAVFGADLPWSNILINTLTAVDSTQGCTVFGTDKRLSAPHAALVNGTLIQGFELDDMHRLGVLHVGAVTLPAVLACVELHPELTGQDMLTAAAAGYEIGPRVGLCMGPEHIAQGWHSGATVGTFSACAGAAAALGLDRAQTVNALGIAGTQAAGLMAAQYGAMVKRMHIGRSAQSGLYAALLASHGFTGIADVFENDYGGFCTTFSRSDDRFNLRELTSRLGERWETMRVSLKFYACAGSNHTTLDAVRRMQARRAFMPNEVEHITVHASRVTVDHAGWPYVAQSLTAAQLNLPYCVATLLLEGDAFIDQFTEAKVADPRRVALSRRVEVIEDQNITMQSRSLRHMVRVEARLRDGTVLQETVDAPRGSELCFASSDAVLEKFRKLAGRRMPEAQVERIAETVMNLDTLESAADLAALLVRRAN